MVPASEGRVGLKSRLIVRDREMLVSNAKRGFKPFEPVRLKDCGPLKIILPGRTNVRRRNIEIYFQTHGVEVADDHRDGRHDQHAAIRPALRLGGDPVRADLHRRHRPDTGRVISPIYDPPLIAEFVVISPARRTLSTQAQLFLEGFEAEIARIQDVWAQTIPPAVYPVRPRRAAAR